MSLPALSSLNCSPQAAWASAKPTLLNMASALYPHVIRYLSIKETTVLEQTSRTVSACVKDALPFIKELNVISCCTESKINQYYATLSRRYPNLHCICLTLRQSNGDKIANKILNGSNFKSFATMPQLQKISILTICGGDNGAAIELDDDDLIPLFQRVNPERLETLDARGLYTTYTFDLIDACVDLFKKCSTLKSCRLPNNHWPIAPDERYELIENLPSGTLEELGPLMMRWEDPEGPYSDPTSLEGHSSVVLFDAMLDFYLSKFPHLEKIQRCHLNLVCVSAERRARLLQELPLKSMTHITLIGLDFDEYLITQLNHNTNLIKLDIVFIAKNLKHQLSRLLNSIHLSKIKYLYITGETAGNIQNVYDLSGPDDSSLGSEFDSEEEGGELFTSLPFNTLVAQKLILIANLLEIKQLNFKNLFFGAQYDRRVKNELLTILFQRKVLHRAKLILDQLLSSEPVKKGTISKENPSSECPYLSAVTIESLKNLYQSKTDSLRVLNRCDLNLNHFSVRAETEQLLRALPLRRMTHIALTGLYLSEDTLTYLIAELKANISLVELSLRHTKGINHLLYFRILPSLNMSKLTLIEISNITNHFPGNWELNSDLEDEKGLLSLDFQQFIKKNLSSFSALNNRGALHIGDVKIKKLIDGFCKASLEMKPVAAAAAHNAPELPPAKRTKY